jgi:hypothetical protein
MPEKTGQIAGGSMSEVRKLHDDAMSLAEMASVAKLRGDLEQAGKLLRQAYDEESKAAKLIIQEVSLEPTRSILFRSADLPLTATNSEKRKS